MASLTKLSLAAALLLSTLCPLPLHSQSTRQYQEYPDTLVLTTHLEKGVGLFSPGAGRMQFRDTSEFKKFDFFPAKEIRYPRNLDSLKMTVFSLYFNPLVFYPGKDGRPSVQSPQGRKDQIVLVVKGRLQGEGVVIVDQNHNFDLNDDPVRQITNTDWFDRDHLIPIEYDVIVDGTTIHKTGWKNILLAHGDTLDFASQHAIAEFSIQGVYYKLGVHDDNSSSFCSIRPQIALFTDLGLPKDTLTPREIAGKGEFVFLGPQPYRFHEFYSGSGTLILVKETQLDKQVGLQVGLKAPDFKIQPLTGEPLEMKNLTKPLMIVNLSGCSGPSTYEKYKKFFGKFSGTHTIIALEPDIPKTLPGILVNTDTPFNKDFYTLYRNAYSSYDVYAIGTNGRIADYFSIYNWETSMKQ